MNLCVYRNILYTDTYIIYIRETKTLRKKKNELKTTSDDLGVGCFNADLGGSWKCGYPRIDAPVCPPKKWEIWIYITGKY